MPGVYDRPWRAVTIAVIGIAVSVLVTGIASGGPQGAVRTVLVTAGAVLPLFAAVVLAPLAASSQGLSSVLGLRPFRVSDLFFGLCAGLVMRAFVEVIAPTGQMPIEWLTSGVLAALVVAVCVSPLAEELLFRGVLQRALADGMRSAGVTLATTVSVAVTTAVFTAVHVLAGSAQPATIVSTVIVGVGCGLLAALTRRTSGAMVAHVVYNITGAVLLVM